MVLLKRKMGHKKGRRVRKTEVPIESPTEFQLGDRAADIQRKRNEREHRYREQVAQKQQREESEREKP